MIAALVVVVPETARNEKSLASRLKIRDPKARADIEDNYRKTIGQALGGVAVLFGAGLAYLQFCCNSSEPLMTS